jgi:hypothetical protein
MVEVRYGGQSCRWTFFKTELNYSKNVLGTKMKTNDVVNNFHLFLQNSLNSAENLLQSENQFVSMEDWCQANWELLVESHLGSNCFLENYGAGGDINGASSRISYPDANATHRIMFRAKNGSFFDVLNNTIYENKAFQFDRFVSFDGTWFGNDQALGFALCDEGPSQKVFHLGEVEFLSAKI